MNDLEREATFEKEVTSDSSGFVLLSDYVPVTASCISR